MSVNKVILIGRLGIDPEIRSFESGAKVATFRIATSESYKNKEGQKVEQTEWHNIVLWRGLADIAEKYLRKGDQIYLEGRIRTRTWEDKDGSKRYTTEIEAQNMTMLGSKKDNDYAPQAPAPTAQDIPANISEEQPKPQSNPAAMDEDDLPF
ncbi:MAG: single-stranded DNA-binding protein [Bacteroidales bacterium]